MYHSGTTEKFDVTGKNVTYGITKKIRISTDEITKALNMAVVDITEAIIQDLDKKFRNSTVKIPKYWGGYVIQPLEIEFWQIEDSRLAFFPSHQCL